jgi:hypothetical protein
MLFQVAHAKLSSKRISLDDIINSPFNGANFCLRTVQSSLFTYKSCMNVGLQLENTLIDVANFTTLNKLHLIKESPYTNCRAKRTLKIRFKKDGKSYMLKHRLVESAKVKYGRGNITKKDLVFKINERAIDIKHRLKIIPRCSS